MDGHSLLFGLLVTSGVVLGVTPLSFAPVTGTTMGAVSTDLVAVQSYQLDGTGNTVNTAATTIVNNDSSHHDGLVRVELRAHNGTILATNSSSSYLKKDRTVSCPVSFDHSTPLNDVQVTVVTVNTSVAIGKKEADCRGKGKGAI